MARGRGSSVVIRLALMGAAVSAGLLALPAGAPRVVAQAGLEGIQDYLVTCRTGGLSIRRFRHSVAPNTVYPITVIEFRRTAVSAGTSLPGPGECAWSDRPVSPGEPNVLVLNSETFGWPFMYRHPADVYGPRGYQAAVARAIGELDAALDRRRALFYVHAFRATRPFRVDLVNAVRPIDLGTNYLEISRVNAIVRVR